jgi:hypothetical protein
MALRNGLPAMIGQVVSRATGVPACASAREGIAAAPEDR